MAVFGCLNDGLAHLPHSRDDGYEALDMEEWESRLGVLTGPNYSELLRRKAHVFDVIEEAISSDDTSRVALVATGLLEGLFTASVAQSLWEQVVPFLGMKSASYLSACI